MVQEPAAEHGVELAVTGDVQGVVLYELEVGQVGVCLDVIAGGNVRLAHFNSHHLESQAREFHRVTALETPDVGESNPAVISGKNSLQNPPGGRRPSPVLMPSPVP